MIMDDWRELRLSLGKMASKLNETEQKMRKYKREAKKLAKENKVLTARIEDEVFFSEVLFNAIPKAVLPVVRHRLEKTFGKLPEASEMPEEGAEA